MRDFQEQYKRLEGNELYRLRGSDFIPVSMAGARYIRRIATASPFPEFETEKFQREFTKRQGILFLYDAITFPITFPINLIGATVDAFKTFGVEKEREAQLNSLEKNGQ